MYVRTYECKWDATSEDKMQKLQMLTILKECHDLST